VFRSAETFAEFGPSARIEAAPEPAEQVDDLAAAEGGPQGHVAGYVGETAVQAGGVPPRIAAEQRHRSAVGAQQTQQDPDGGGLAGAVGAEETVHLARGHGEVEAVQSDGGSERLA